MNVSNLDEEMNRDPGCQILQKHNDSFSPTFTSL